MNKNKVCPIQIGTNLGIIKIGTKYPAKEIGMMAAPKRVLVSTLSGKTSLEMFVFPGERYVSCTSVQTGIPFYSNVNLAVVPKMKGFIRIIAIDPENKIKIKAIPVPMFSKAMKAADRAWVQTGAENNYKWMHDGSAEATLADYPVDGNEAPEEEEAYVPPPANQTPNPMPECIVAHIGSDDITAVSHRELYQKLGFVGLDPDALIALEIHASSQGGQRGWVKDVDYAIIPVQRYADSSSESARKIIVNEYACSLKMSAHIAMKANTRMGEEIRDYLWAKENASHGIEAHKGWFATTISKGLGTLSNLFGSRMDQNDKMQRMILDQQAVHSHEINEMRGMLQNLTALSCELIDLIPSKTPAAATAPQEAQPVPSKDTYYNHEIAEPLGLPRKCSPGRLSPLGLAGELGWVTKTSPEPYWKVTPLGENGGYVIPGTPNPRFTQKGLDVLKEVVAKRTTKV